MTSIFRVKQNKKQEEDLKRKKVFAHLNMFGLVCKAQGIIVRIMFLYPF